MVRRHTGGGGGHTGIVVLTDKVQIGILIDGQIVTGGADDAGHVGQLPLSGLGDGVDQIQHGLLLHAVHIAMIEIVADLAVVDLVLQLDTDGNHRHHVRVLSQHLAHGGDVILYVLIRHLGVAVHLGGNIPGTLTLFPVFAGDGGVHGQGPQHGNIHLAEDIQQAAHILQVVLLDAQHVAVIVIHHALAEGGSLIADDVVAEGLQVVQLAVNVEFAVLVNTDFHPAVVAQHLGVHIVAGETVTQELVLIPREPNALDIAVALQDILDQVGLFAPHLRRNVGLGDILLRLYRSRRGAQYAGHNHYDAE